MKEQAESTVPQIRFRGFSLGWAEMPMGELLSFKNGYNAGGDQYGTGEKFINVLDIIENDYITYDRILGRVNITAKDFKINEVRYGDILFQRSSETREEVGQANVYLDKDRTATFGGFIIRGQPIREFDSVFFNAMLKSAKVRAEITSRSGGSTRYNIGQESLEDAVVHIATDLFEQQKIANFWMTLEHIIGLHQQKHAKLVALKQAMLQKMFPQDVSTTPEVRFKGFEEAWGSMRLGQACVIGDVDHWMPKSVSKGIPYVMTGDFCGINELDFETAKQISYDDFEELAKKIRPEKGDILFARYASIGAVRYVETDRKFIASYSCAILKNRDHDAFSTRFLFFLIQSEKYQLEIKLLINQGSQSNIGNDSLNNLQIVVPTLD